MAFTDEQRLQAAALALMRYSVVHSGGSTPTPVTQLIAQPTHTAGWPPDVFPFNAAYDTLTASDYVSVSHSYTIT